MRRRNSRRPPADPDQQAPAPTSLAPAEAPARLVGLLRQHDRIRAAIAAKKRSLVKLSAAIDAAMQRLARAQPAIEGCRSLDREIHALFGELLARRPQTRAARSLVAELYEALQGMGVLTRPERSPEPGPDEPDLASADDEAAVPPRQAATEARSAQRPGDEAGHQSIRALFRDLARAMHPDKVLDEQEKARRTEAMKDISRAYADGDLARLLDLERRWMGGGDVTANPDDVERRCANLERLNADLVRQLAVLTAEVRDLRRSPAARLTKDLRPSRHAGELDPAEEMIAEAEEDLLRLRELRVWVTAFRDGKLTLEAFARGPGPVPPAPARGGRREPARRRR